MLKHKTQKVYSLCGYTADENCVSLWSFYVTSEENTIDENDNGVASKSEEITIA